MDDLTGLTRPRLIVGGAAATLDTPSARPRELGREAVELLAQVPHAGDEPRGVEEQQPAVVVAGDEGGGAGAEQVQEQRHDQEALAPDAVRHPPEVRGRRRPRRRGRPRRSARSRWSVMSSVFGLESTPVTELAMVIWSPSRIQAAPRPATIRVWKGLQLNLSRRAGIVERSGTDALADIDDPLRIKPCHPSGRTVYLDRLGIRHTGPAASRRASAHRGEVEDPPRAVPGCPAPSCPAE